MIRYLKYNEIDIQKYNNCIESSINSRIYAFSWYLDCVADNWDALVLNDYEAVMPLPYSRLKRSFFINKIVQPPFCQQLGVFSELNISDEILKEFIHQFLKLKPITYNFNSKNKVVNNLKKHFFYKKNNYELDLPQTLIEIRGNYYKDLQKNLRKADKKNLNLSTKVSFDDFIFLKQMSKSHKIKNKHLKVMKELMEELTLRTCGKINGVELNNKIIASAFVSDSKNRRIILFSVTTEEGRKLGAMSYLYNTIIMDCSPKIKIFDFGGSMIPTVARFFKSFGSKQINYYNFNN